MVGKIESSVWNVPGVMTPMIRCAMDDEQTIANASAVLGRDIHDEVVAEARERAMIDAPMMGQVDREIMMREMLVVDPGSESIAAQVVATADGNADGLANLKRDLEESFRQRHTPLGTTHTP